jgi:hypothetical protein
MKRFFARNKRVVEIFLTLALVFLVAGYYYLIFIPERETELIARRFRTLQRIEQNMREKLDGYQNTIKNCLVKADKSYFRQILTGYNSDTDKFHLSLLDSGSITRQDFHKKKDIEYIKIAAAFVDSIAQSYTIRVEKNGKKLAIDYDWYKYQDVKHNTIKHLRLNARIDYSEFVKPLLKKSVFDHYIVFNVQQEVSNIVFEDFPSGISFKGLDSLFDTKEKVYTSKIIKIETGGEKYLVFLHPCGYNNKNDRIVAGLLKQKTFDAEKRRLPDSVVTTVLFITLFVLLLLPVIRLTLMGKKERIRFVDLFTGYFSFLLLVPVIMLAFFWNNKRFISQESNRADSKKVLADQISKSLNKEIEAAYNLLDTFDWLHSDSTHPDSKKLSLLQNLNVRHLKDSAYLRYFDNEKKQGGKSIDEAVQLLGSIIKSKTGLYKNTEYVFWMDSTGKEFSNWAFGDDPPRGDYKERNYFKNVQDNNLLSLPGNAGKKYAIDAIVSRIDGKFKVVIAKKSRDKKSVVASPSRFESVINPVLPLGYEFSIIDADGKTVFDSDTTENLNENLTEEFVEGTQLKVVLDTKTSREFETRHEDEDFKVLAQPIPGLPFTIVILERKSFNASLYTQCLSFTMVMMFSFFIFLCFEMALILIAHKQSTKLLKNNFDFAWIHPRMNFSGKYFALFLFNGFVLLVLILFCFIKFSIDRLTEYIFLIVVASLVTSIAAFAFKATNGNASSAGTSQLKNEKTTMKLLALVVLIALIDSVSYSVHWHVLLFLIIVGGAFFLLFKNRYTIHGNRDYMVNFRLMIFSRLLLTSGLPVIVFFNCIYNFEQRLQERLKLLDYAEKIQQHTREGEKTASIIAQLSDSDMVRSFYFDNSWVGLDNQKSNIVPPGDTVYSKTDSFCLGLLKAAHLHYGDVSDSTEGFELIRPFSNSIGDDSARFAFNNIFTGEGDKIKFKITQNDTSGVQFLTLASDSNKYCFPSIFKSSAGTIFWILLFTCIGFTYLLLIYATNKIFGKYIPDIEDFKKIHDDLLLQKDIKYLFVQGIPGSGKSSFIKNNLGKIFTFCDKQKQPANYNATFFNLSEIPEPAEMSSQKAAFDNRTEFTKPAKDNWFCKVSEIMTDKIECVIFTHFEYKIFDEYVNDIKLTLIEKLLGVGKKKIILSSDIDPLEYFYSLKKFMPSSAEKKDSNSTTDSNASNSFFEFQNRWNNLLGRFANIFMNIENIPAKNPGDSFKKKFLNEECSNPAFLKNYKVQFQEMSIDEGNEEDYVLKIQSLCDHTYRQIFSSLTKEEQLTLYDLAEDGLMNTTNYISLTMLLNKGLVIKDDNGVLLIVNRSFRNFILTMVKAEDVKSIEKEISDDHTWNDYKYPVFILLGALLYFVLSSNPEKFGNVLPVVTGVLAGIPTILKMLSFMKPGESKS